MTSSDPISPPKWFDHQSGLWEHLTPTSQRALATAARLQPALEVMPDADGSFVLTLAFKALEIELQVRILGPFRLYRKATESRAGSRRLTNELLAHRWSRPLGAFLAGGRLPALAATAGYMASLAHVAADAPGNAFALLKTWLRKRYPLGHRLWGPKLVARKLEAAAIAFRNPFTHSRAADPALVAEGVLVLWGRPGNHGVGHQVLRTLTEGLPPPVRLPETCPRCGHPLFLYPCRIPERFCIKACT
jgi:hypothetical protein